MKGQREALIAVDIGISAIRTYQIEINGDYFVKEIAMPSCSTPGALTIFVSEAITLIDPDFCFNAVSIAIPAVIDRTGRCIETCPGLIGWNNVPFAEWLEIRLQRRVDLVTKGSFLPIQGVFEFFCNR